MISPASNTAINPLASNTQYGFVPGYAIGTVAERKWSQVSAASSPMVIRLRESIEKLEKKLIKATDAGDTAKVAELEAQLATQRQWLAQAD